MLAEWLYGQGILEKDVKDPTSLFPITIHTRHCMTKPEPETMRKTEVDPLEIERYLAQGRSDAARIIAHMKTMGVEVELIGSMKTGDALPHADIDLLVVNCGGMRHELVLHEMMLLEQGVPLDVTFFEMLPAEIKPSFRG